MEKDKERIQMLAFDKNVVDFQYEPINLTNKKWALYGKDNRLPFYLMQILKDSPTHSGIVKNKHKFMKGEGFADNFIVDETDDTTLYDLYDRLAFDFIIYGGFAIRIFNYKGKRQLAHIDFGKIRVGTGVYMDKPVNYYYSNDWSKKANPSVIEFPRYDGEDKDTKEGSLLYYKDYNSLSEYYPVPDYFGARDSIMAEMTLQKYLTSIMDNSYLPKNMFKFKYNPIPEEQSKLLRNLQDSYKGVENAGKPIVLTNMADTESVKVETLDSTIVDPNFAIIDETITQKIVSAHNIPRELATLNNPTGFSNSAEQLKYAFEYFNKNYIEDKQRRLTGTIAKLTGKKVIVSPLDLIKTQLSEDTLNKILTVDEMRVQYGYKPLPKSEQPNPKTNESI